jgi:hypothetical protein
MLSGIIIFVESSWNVMAHGDAREGKWLGNWRMEWVASTLHTISEHDVLPLMRTPRLPAVDWTDAPADLKFIRPFRRKTKSGFCACAITFQLASTYVCMYMPPSPSHCSLTPVVPSQFPLSPISTQPDISRQTAVLVLTTAALVRLSVC